MKTILQSILASLLLMFTTVATIHAEKNELVNNLNQFAIDLYNQIDAQEQGNILFSPHNITTALAITYAGAKGNTKTQIANVLHLGNVSEEEVHVTFSKLNQTLQSKSTNEFYQLSIANNLWIQETELKLAESFINVLKSYGSTPALANFQTEPEIARQKINAWVEKQTVGKIQDMLQPNAIDTGTNLALVSALYFKGSWAIPFNPNKTQSLPFVISSNQTIDVPTMELTADLNYLEDKTAQIIELPYIYKSNLSMLIVLPKNEKGEFHLKHLATLDKHLETTAIKLFLPKFKIESGFELKQYLQILKMEDAFIAEKADFSGINEKKGLVLSSVVHKTFVDVDEQGTEAAAATAVIMGKGLKKEITPLILRIDRPFIFLIRDKKSGAILFLGKVTNPTSNEGTKGIRG